MMPTQRKILVFVLVATCTSLYFYNAIRSRYVRMSELKGTSLKGLSCPIFNSLNNSNVTQGLPRIMMWTKFFSDWYGPLNDTRIGEVLLENCTVKCFVTNDPCLVEYSDATVFHVRNLEMTDLPQKRFSWQKWIFYLMEPPPNTDFTDFNLTHGMFNWTMTYRKDSDVYVPYGRIVPREAVATNTKRDLKALWKSKKKTAVWMVSNCLTNGGRERFVAQLKKYMDVDVYGFCGDHKCPMSRGISCYVDFERTYFFALAFENSICADYVTEKFYTALEHDIIPVVFGGANYSHIAPNHSFIDALSFESPKDLAEYLIKLSKNYTEYATYLKWKDSHDIVQWHPGFCELCTKLHSHVEFQRTSSYADIGAWWLGKGRCRRWRSGAHS
ncbi:alpha-(1,3)-fucosyltransferase C-like isoform X2 [Dermacentor silvarum]|nr:alpha-(1,3)-fucosyltransferase C-like isoform X2 [Dermacentor silvarum]